MSKVVLLDNPVLKYRPNSSVPPNIAAVAAKISCMLGYEEAETVTDSRSPYFVPFAAVHSSLASEHGIVGIGDLYGGIVEEHQHADKAILHVLPMERAKHPVWYSPAFAQAVQPVVLPGFTAFTANDALHAYRQICSEQLSVRLKDPSNTGGLGQHCISDDGHLQRTLDGYGNSIASTGVTLEADLEDAITITIGYVEIDGHIYSWRGRPYDVLDGDMMRFGGNELTVVRGNFDVLHRHTHSLEDRLAIDQAKIVFTAYKMLGAKISRATLDVVQGTARDGRYLSGVTDPSLRPSASSAAELRAIEALQATPSTEVAMSRLLYDYTRTIHAMTDLEVFMSHPRMNILVELLSVT